MYRFARPGALLATLLVAAPPPAVAVGPQDTGVDWQVEFAPYLWLISADGNVRVGNLRVPVSVPFGDLFERLNIAGMLEVEVRWKRWLAFVDGRYTALSDDSPRFDLDQATVEFGLGRRVWTGPLGDPSGNRALHLDLYAGGRWWWTEQTLDVLGLRLRGEATWADPIVGGRLVADLAERWRAELRGDLGGFGVASDLTWDAALEVGYRITPRWTAELGFRGLGVDFETGSSRFLSDLIYWGPVLGISYRFGGRRP